MMQQHRQLSCGRHDRSFLPALPAALRQLQSPTSEITVDAKWSQDVLRSLHQQRSQIGIAFFADMQLRLAPPRVAPSRLQAQITTHVPTFTKAMRIFQRQQERQRDQRAYALDLLQQRHLRITLLCQILDALVVFHNALAQRLDCVQ